MRTIKIYPQEIFPGSKCTFDDLFSLLKNTLAGQHKQNERNTRARERIAAALERIAAKMR